MTSKIATTTNSETAQRNAVHVAASMRAVGNKKVVTENHKFAVKDAKNEELYALEAEVQYTVSPTVRQDTYKISDLTVKIQPRGSDTALIYTSNNTSEVSLPKRKALFRRDSTALRVQGRGKKRRNNQQAAGYSLE